VNCCDACLGTLLKPASTRSAAPTESRSMTDLLAAAPTRFMSLFGTAPETPNNQLSVGIGGDIPIFPPFFVLLMSLAGFVLQALLPRLPFLPPAVSKLAVRIPLFLVAAATFFTVVNSSGAALEQAGTKVDFGPVSKIASSGFFAYSRNPIYTVGLVVLAPGFVILADSYYMILAHTVTAAYLFAVVIPAEEAFLLRTIGAEYARYCATVPRTFDLLIPGMLIGATAAVHVGEIRLKLPLLRRQPEGLKWHLLQTMLWGFLWWTPLEAAERKKNA